MYDLALALVVFMPLVISFFMKSNAALGFLTICLGFVVSTSVIGDLRHLLSETSLSVSNEALAVGLIVVPFLITLLLSRKKASKDAIFFMELIVSVFSGGLLALTIGPLLNSAGSLNIMASKMWPNLVKAQAIVIGIGALLSMMLLWASGIKSPKKH